MVILSLFLCKCKGKITLCRNDIIIFILLCMVCEFLYVNLHIMIHSSLQQEQKICITWSNDSLLRYVDVILRIFRILVNGQRKEYIICTNEYNLCYNHTFKKPTCAFLSRVTTAFSSASDK